MEEIDMEIVQPQEPVTAVQLDENNVVCNFISVMSVNDMPNCVEWQDGIGIGDTYNPEDGTFTKFIPPKIVPQSVTMRQARLALLGAGLLDDVITAIESLEEPTKSAAKIEWEFSSEIQRNRPLVATLGPLLGLSEEQLDDLFIQASAL